MPSFERLAFATGLRQHLQAFIRDSRRSVAGQRATQPWCSLEPPRSVAAPHDRSTRSIMQERHEPVNFCSSDIALFAKLLSDDEPSRAKKSVVLRPCFLSWRRSCKRKQIEPQPRKQRGVELSIALLTRTKKPPITWHSSRRGTRDDWDLRACFILCHADVRSRAAREPATVSQLRQGYGFLKFGV